MKKTLKSLLIAGALFFAAPMVSNAALSIGQVVTLTLTQAQSDYLSGLNPAVNYPAGSTFTFVVVMEPENGDPYNIEQLENLVNSIYQFDLGQLGAPKVDDVTLQYLAPVDLGLSAVLGAGAIAAVKRARNKRKQNVTA